MDKKTSAGVRAVGSVVEIHRFAVKSMRGESLLEAPVDKSGVAGDRQWALRDLVKNELTSAKHFPRIMQLSARTSAESAQRAHITFPNGDQLASDDPGLDSALSSFLKHEVSICRLGPQQNKRHFRLRRFRSPAELRRLLGVRRGGPLPDLSQLSLSMLATLSIYATPPGSYLDALPLHLVSTSSMAALARTSGVPVTSERFRPNFVVNTGDQQGDYPERSWRGCRLLIGEAELEVCAETFRCGMPAHHQSGNLPKAPEIVKAIYGELGSKFGVYARVIRPGRVRLGDRAVLAARAPSPLTVLEDLGSSMKRAVLEAFLSL